MADRAALELYEPILEPKPFGEDVWIVDGPCISMRYAGFFRLPFTTRMTVILLPGGLWVHSPIRLSDQLKERIDSLGTVRWLVAPNSLHWVYAADWKAHYPNAELWAVEVLASSGKVPADKVIGMEAHWPGICQVVISGDAITEAVFFHETSRTLILTDLIENFEPRKVRSPVIRLLARLGRILDPDGQTPLDLRFTFIRQRKALRSAVEQMIAWNPERIILTHGRPYAENGTAELRRAFRCILGGNE